MAQGKRATPWFLWPIVTIWNLIASIVTLTGRFLAILLGIVIMIGGVLISLTVIGAIVGIPMIILGALLVIRGLW